MKLIPLNTMIFLALRFLKAKDKRQRSYDDFRPEEIRNILVVSSTAIGDTLLSTPAIAAVRRRYPWAQIIALLNKNNRELFDNNPHINGVVSYHGGYKRFFRTLMELRRYRFDLALIFHGNEPQATPLAYLSGAPFLFKLPVARRYSFLLTNPSKGFADPWKHHAIDVRLKTAFFAGCSERIKRMTLVVKDKDLTFTEDYLLGLGLTRRNILIGFHIGAADRYKMWPQSHFVELGRNLRRLMPNIRILITGSEEERSLCLDTAEKIGERAYSLAGELSLGQTAALIKGLCLLVTNDTGPLHIAIALGTRTVSLFCPTNHWGVGPLYDQEIHTVIHKPKPCSRCVTKKCKNPFCMASITVDEVFDAVRASLDL